MLKAKRIRIQIHPIVNRLVQTKKLLMEIEKTESMDKEIDYLLLLIKNGRIEEIIKKQKTNDEENNSNKNTVLKRKLKLLEILKDNKNKASQKRALENTDHIEMLENTDQIEMLENTDEIEMSKKKKKVEKTKFKFEQSSSDENEDMDMEVDETKEDTELTRRAITKQIEKNRGLTPYRKKELRNPRVKHRNKYRRALIRRKGMVRIFFLNILTY